jgi:hypothetical protein
MNQYNDRVAAGKTDVSSGGKGGGGDKPKTSK